MFTNPLYSGRVEVFNVEEAFDIVKEMIDTASAARTSYQKPYYVDIAATFDIETTVVENLGFPRREEGKFSHFNYCYCWQACFNGILVFGRYIDEWFTLCNRLSGVLGDKRLLIYVHNIAYEYNNLAEYFIKNADHPEKDLFFRDRVHPLYILNKSIEYRCSYQLTHKSLEKLSKEVGLEKSGDLDYNIPRHSETPLTETEIEYCLRDVYNLYKWIEKEYRVYSESIKKKPHLCYMPLTQTGYVRYDIKHDFSNTKKGAFYNKDNFLTEEQYNVCHAAFRGGDTHAAYFHLCKTYDNSVVRHRDFTSAYPAKLVLEKYPWKGFKNGERETLNYYYDLINRGKAVIATLDLRNVELKDGLTSYIAVSSCHYISKERIIENGRVMSAEQILLTVTEIDFSVIVDVYNFDIAGVTNIIYASKAYVPPELAKIVLKYFAAKTTLKGVPNGENEYRLSKEKLNAIYGCAATALRRPKIVVDTETFDTLEQSQEYKEGRVLPYAIGVYITAYLRADLNYFKNLLKRDFLYCDTDSIFYLQNEKFEKEVERYNKRNREKLHQLAERLNVDIDFVMPKNPKGERQYLGEFMADDDYIIDRFITCGAKRYVTERTERGQKRVDMTFSGVGDTKAIYKNGQFTKGANVRYLEKSRGKDIFKVLEEFPETPLYIPYETETGKLTHYIERGDFHGVINDGHSAMDVSARSSMVLVPIDLHLGLEPTLMELLIYNNLLWTML